VDWVDLGEADVIDKLVSRYRQSVMQPDNDDIAHEVAHELHIAVWSKITAAAGRKRRWLISPDGALRLVPWNILLSGQADEGELIMLTSGRDLTRWAEGNGSQALDMVVGVSRFGTKTSLRLSFS
jgi:hypothetical protein